MVRIGAQDVPPYVSHAVVLRRAPGDATGACVRRHRRGVSAPAERSVVVLYRDFLQHQQNQRRVKFVNAAENFSQFCGCHRGLSQNARPEMDQSILWMSQGTEPKCKSDYTGVRPALTHRVAAIIAPIIAAQRWVAFVDRDVTEHPLAKLSDIAVFTSLLLVLPCHGQSQAVL
jgi:hypothetical protein